MSPLKRKRQPALAPLQLHGGIPCPSGPAWELCRKEGDCFCELRVLGTLSVESLFGYEAHVVKTRFCGLGA